MPSYGQVAKSVREDKERHPENYCSHPRCLWRIQGRFASPCRNHPHLNKEKIDSFVEDVLSNAKVIGDFNVGA